ncbi:MAG: hypothetical protein ACRCZ9_11290 [Fusobacteriaceae bacterium]
MSKEKKYDNDFITKEFFSFTQFGEEKGNNKRFTANIANRFSIWIAIKSQDQEGKYRKTDASFFSRLEELTNLYQMISMCINEAKDGNGFDTCVIAKDKEFGIVGRKSVNGDVNVGIYIKNKESNQSAIAYLPSGDSFYINNPVENSPAVPSKALAILEEFRMKIGAIINRSSTVYAAHLKEVADKEYNKKNGPQDRGYSDTGSGESVDKWDFE